MKSFFRAAPSRVLSHLLKIVIAVGLVAWIFRRVDVREIVKVLLGFPPQLMLGLSALTLILLGVQFLRWKILIQQNSRDFRTKDLLPSFVAGFTFRFVLPGGHAELTKVLLLKGKKSGKWVAFGMEKFVQTISKLGLVAIAIPFTFPKYALPSIATLLVMLALFTFLPRLGILRKWQEAAPNNHRLLARGILLTLATYLVLVLQFHLILSQRFGVSIVETAHAVVYLWGISAIPISLSGLGIREGLAIYLLRSHGVQAEYAVASSLVLFTINDLLPALTGTVILWRRRALLADMQSAARNGWQRLRTLRTPEERNRTDA